MCMLAALIQQIDGGAKTTGPAYRHTAVDIQGMTDSMLGTSIGYELLFWDDIEGCSRNTCMEIMKKAADAERALAHDSRDMDGPTKPDCTARTPIM